MHRPMLLLTAALAGACAGVSPDPAAMEADAPTSSTDVDAPALDAQVERARDRLVAGDVAGARSIVDDVLAANPGHARARAVFAHCLMAEARADRPPTLAPWRRAEGELRRATRIAAADPVVARMHGEFLIEDGHLTAAAERLEEGLRYAPTDPALLALAARVRFDLGDEHAAIGLLERRLAVVREDAAATWQLAQCQARLADAEFAGVERDRLVAAAIASFARYRALAPEDADGPLAEAQLRMRQPGSGADAPDGEAVVALYRLAMQLRPGSAEPVFGLGAALEAAGRDAEARTAYEQALGIDASHVPSLLNLAANLAASGDRAGARPLLERALAAGVTGDERDRIEAFLADGG